MANTELHVLNWAGPDGTYGPTWGVPRRRQKTIQDYLLDSAYTVPTIDLNTVAPKTTLQGYTGKTAVGVTPEQRGFIDLATQLFSGGYGNLLQMLSGAPDRGSFQRGVVDPLQRQFKNQTLPRLAESFSGGPYGSSYWSGARSKAQASAQNQLNDILAQLYYQELGKAKEQGLSAAQTLPGLYNIVRDEAQQEAANLERAIAVHYRNQGLSTQQLQNDMSRLSALLQIGDQSLKAQGRKQADLHALLQAQTQRAGSTDQLVATLHGQDLAQEQFDTNQNNALTVYKRRQELGLA